MSCLRPSMTEPEFEPVTSLDQFCPQEEFPSPPRGRFIATTNSTPRLRLDFDDQEDHLMTEEDFEDIMHHQEDEAERPMSPPLPDPPTLPGFIGCRAITADREMPRTGYGDVQASSSKLNYQTDLQRRLTNLDLASSRITHAAGEDDDEGADYDYSHEGTVKGKEKARVKLRPKPISIVPRVGTLTALPGSVVAGARESVTTAAFAGGLSSESPEPRTASTIVSKSIPHAPLTPVTPMSAPPAPGHRGMTFTRKRKLSLSAPFNTVKRILTPKKTNITHLTHEATARNRPEGGVKTHHSDDNDEILDPDTPVPRRDLVTPISTGPSTPYPDPQTPGSKSKSKSPSYTPRATIFHHPFHRQTASTTSTSTDPNPTLLTSKSTLNRMIIQLRGQVSDLTLENRVLKEQVALVRKDWIDTSQELDLERFKAWENEMKAFKLGILVEELKTEVAMLKRGSMA